jgi:hypothetical protein
MRSISVLGALALIAYVKAHTPFTAGTLDRITRL